MPGQPFDGEFGAIGDVGFGKYVADAVADRAFAEKQPGRDLTIVQSLGHKFQHVQFAFGKAGETFGWSAGIGVPRSLNCLRIIMRHNAID